MARLTPLGWTCVGPINRENNHDSTSMFVFHANNTLETSLKQFWVVESETECNQMSLEDKKVQVKIENSIEHKDNRYIVPLPWKSDKETLPDNYSSALNRLYGTEKKLKKSPELKQEYSDIIRKYEEKGFIKKVERKDNEKRWYLPHFDVVKPEKETTKVRIVFDASSKHEGTSLNEYLSTGPKLQRELFDVLLRFRRNQIAVVCDIAEMYLKVGLASEDQKYQRFLWRESPESPIETFEFTRLVFGVNSSPYLAQYVSQHNAVLHADIYPMAAETILKFTYMDDSMDSTKNVTEGIELCRQLRELWQKADMHARKWISNSREVLETIPEEDRAAEIDLGTGNLPITKALGISWQAKHDEFIFKVGDEMIMPDESQREMY